MTRRSVSARQPIDELTGSKPNKQDDHNTDEAESTVSTHSTEKPAGWPQPIGSDALVGLAGDVVRLIDPHTEADPMSILLQLLVAFGNVVGRNPYFQVEANLPRPSPDGSSEHDSSRRAAVSRNEYQRA